MRIMFDFFRKYKHCFILLIISSFMLLLMAEAYEDAVWGHAFASTTACMDNGGDDVDLDEDENDDGLSEVCACRTDSFVPEKLIILSQKLTDKKISKALRIGQVRRCFPRGALSERDDCAFFPNISGGMDCSIPLFLCKNIQKQLLV